MRRGWGAGEQTDRKREACQPPERKLTSGSSGVSQPQPEPAASSQPGLVLRPGLSIAWGVAGKYGTGFQLWGRCPYRAAGHSWPLKTPRHFTGTEHSGQSGFRPESFLSLCSGTNLCYNSLPRAPTSLPFQGSLSPKGWKAGWWSCPGLLLSLGSLLSTLLPPWLEGPSSSVWLRVVTAILELLEFLIPPILLPFCQTQNSHISLFPHYFLKRISLNLMESPSGQYASVPELSLTLPAGPLRLWSSWGPADLCQVQLCTRAAVEPWPVWPSG